MEPTIDLFAIAIDNAVSLVERLDSLRAGLQQSEADALVQFATRIQQDGRISINMRQMDLISFLTFGRYQNIYE